MYKYHTTYNVPNYIIKWILEHDMNVSRVRTNENFCFCDLEVLYVYLNQE